MDKEDLLLGCFLIGLGLLIVSSTILIFFQETKVQPYKALDPYTGNYTKMYEEVTQTPEPVFTIMLVTTIIGAIMFVTSLIRI